MSSNVRLPGTCHYCNGLPVPPALARSQCPRLQAAQAQGKKHCSSQTDHKRRQTERGQQQQQQEQQQEVRWAIVLTCLGSWIHLQRCS